MWDFAHAHKEHIAQLGLLSTVGFFAHNTGISQNCEKVHMYIEKVCFVDSFDFIVNMSPRNYFQEVLPVQTHV